MNNMLLVFVCMLGALYTGNDTESPDYKWEDLGCIVQSVPGRDHWNAIDPNLIVDETGWLQLSE